jgi:uncharacterized protein YjiS (DUF1127 family)
MTIHTLHGPAGAGSHTGSGPIRLAFDRIIRLLRAIQARRSVKQLLAWDDRMLRDIGLTRGDVVAAMSGPIFNDAGRRLSHLTSERQQADHGPATRARPTGRASLTGTQCDINTGSAIDFRMLAVVPPRMNSRSRLWP